MADGSEKNGIVIDFNGITRREYREWVRGRNEAEDRDVWDAERLYTRIIVEWPFDQPITPEGYDNLTQVDALAVDAAVSDALVKLHRGE